MGVKRNTALIFVLGFLVLTCIACYSIPRLTSPKLSSNQEYKLFRQTDYLNSKAKLELPAYPEVTGINITDNDNISLYASSGDGLSRNTAFIIENVSIVNPFDNYSLYLFDVSDFLLIRNIQIFSSNIYAIYVATCSNVSFENITVQNDGSLVNYHFGIYFEDCSSILFSNASLYDSVDVAIRSCTDSVFEDMTFFDIYSYSISSLSNCQNITILRNYFSQNVHYFNEFRYIYTYLSNNISFKENYWENHNLRINDCNNVEILDNQFNNSSVSLSSSMYATIRNNSMVGGYISLPSCRYILVELNSMTQSEGIGFYRSYDCLITKNTIETSDSVLILSDKNTRIQFEHNVVECNGEYVIKYDEYNKNEPRINVDLSIRRNRFSGKFSHFYNIPNKAMHFFMLFTNIFPFNMLLCIEMVFICIFIIAIILLLRFHSSTLLFDATDKENIDMRKVSNFTIPIISGILLTVFTSPLTTKNTLISSVLIQWGLISESKIIPLHLILQVLLWLTGLGLIILYIFKRDPKTSRKLQQRETLKSSILKASLIPFISTILLFYPLQILYLTYSRWVIMLFLSILLLVIGVGYRKELKIIKLKGSNITLFGFLILLDFVLCILFVVKQPIPVLLERPVGYTLGFLLKLVFIFIPAKSLVNDWKYQHKTRHDPLAVEKAS